MTVNPGEDLCRADLRRVRRHAAQTLAVWYQSEMLCRAERGVVDCNGQPNAIPYSVTLAFLKI